MLNANLLTGSRIRLTAIQETDYPTIAAWYQDVDFLRHLDAIPAKPKTLKNITKQFDEMIESEGNFVFAIRPLDEDGILGYISVEAVLWNQAVAWMAMAIGQPEDRGRGIGQEAIRLVLAFAFQELNLHRVQLTVFDYNRPAIAAYEKMGFTKEGAFREFLHRDGKRYDMHLYGLLRSEWEAGQQ
ncbi:MAG TPA: GNAT family protein [Bacilli bacterium]|nr:GNAT family protein [Bacilli bacterium]